MLAEVANRADYPAAAAKTATAAHRIDIHTDAAGRIEQRGTVREYAAAPRGQEHDLGVLRGHQRVVIDGVGEGEITSGGFSPTMERSIALARVPAGDYTTAKVDIRGKLQDVRIVKTPFVRNGEIRIDV